MRKPAFCKCKIKGADQLHGNHTADQGLCSHYIDRTFRPQTIFCNCTAGFVSDLVGKTKDRVSHDVAQKIPICLISMIHAIWAKSNLVHINNFIVTEKI